MVLNLSLRCLSSLPIAAVEPDLPSLVASLVLAHSPSSTSPKTLTLALSPHLPHLTPSVVDRTLKLLWNDGPRALLFFRSVPRLSLSPSSLDLAADIAARIRDSKTLALTLSLRRDLRLPLTPRTFSILAERFASHGKPDRAVRLFLNLHLHGCNQDLNTFNTLLDVLAKSGRVEKAYGLLRALRGRFGADTVSYNVIAEGWCRVKRTARAMEVMKEMVELGLEPSLNTYNILLKGFFRAGQLREGQEFFAQMKKRGRKGGKCCRPDVVSYTTVVHGLGIDGQIERARKVFDEMIGEGVLPNVATYNALIQVCSSQLCILN